jgi:hypothetical protein
MPQVLRHGELSGIVTKLRYDRVQAAQALRHRHWRQGRGAFAIGVGVD